LNRRNIKSEKKESREKKETRFDLVRGPGSRFFAPSKRKTAGHFALMAQQLSDLFVLKSGFVRVLEILESPGILFGHFLGLSSPGKLMQVLEIFKILY